MAENWIFDSKEYGSCFEFVLHVILEWNGIEQQKLFASQIAFKWKVLFDKRFLFQLSAFIKWFLEWTVSWRVKVVFHFRIGLSIGWIFTENDLQLYGWRIIYRVAPKVFRYVVRLVWCRWQLKKRLNAGLVARLADEVSLRHHPHLSWSKVDLVSREVFFYLDWWFDEVFPESFYGTYYYWYDVWRYLAALFSLLCDVGGCKWFIKPVFRMRRGGSGCMVT